MSADQLQRNRAILAELRLLCAQGVISEEQRQKIATRYPEQPWDVVVLTRWFTLLGAVCAGLGMFLLVWERFNAYWILECVFGGLLGGLLLLGRYLSRQRALPRAGAAVELLACFALSGLSFTLAKHYSRGSGNWPALVGIDSCLLLGLAYALRNRLVLIYTCVNLFTWFGGSTGYISGWGAYWLGLNYPARFLAAGALCGGIGLVHTHSRAQLTWLRPYASFGRVYIHFGLLSMNIALWFLALFGYFGEDISFRDNAGERLLFSAVWATFAGGSLWLGSRSDEGALRGYGVVFLLINLYTFYCQFVVANSAEAWWLHMLLIGGSLLFLGVYLERHSKRLGAAHPETAANTDLPPGAKTETALPEEPAAPPPGAA